MVLALALASAPARGASLQATEDEDRHTPRIGIYVETLSSPMPEFHRRSRSEHLLPPNRDAIVRPVLERLGALLAGQAPPTPSEPKADPAPGTLATMLGEAALREAGSRSTGGALLPRTLFALSSTQQPASALIERGEWPWSAPVMDRRFAAASKLPPLREPRAVVVGFEAVVVVDRGDHGVLKLNAESGALLARVGGRGVGEGQFIRPNDVTVDDSGAIYVVDTGNHRVQKFDADLNFVRSWGAFGPHPGFFAFPEGLAHFEGSIYVADTDNHRIQVFDLDGGLKYEWGLHALAPREGEGKLHYPSDVVVTRGPQGLVAVVVEPFEDRFQVFRETRPGEEPPKPAIPDRVVAAHFGPQLDLAEDLVVMLEPGAPSLLLYDIEHEVQPWEPIQVSRSSAWGRKTGQLRWPTDVAIDAQRRWVYVADADAGVLASYSFARTRESALEYNPFEFKLVRSLDLAEHRRLETPRRELEIQPAALELHPSGQLYVLDALQSAVFVFTPQLELARVIELASVEDHATARLVDLAFAPDGQRLYVIDELAPALAIVDLTSDEHHAQRLPRPTEHFPVLRPGGIAVGPDGRVYVSDVTGCAIHGLDAQTLRWTWSVGSPGLGRAQFHKPRGLTFDEQGRLWVVDWGNHRGQVLTAKGEFVAAFGSRLFTRPTLSPPR